MHTYIQAYHFSIEGLLVFHTQTSWKVCTSTMHVDVYIGKNGIYVSKIQCNILNQLLHRTSLMLHAKFNWWNVKIGLKSMPNVCKRYVSLCHNC